MCELTVHVKAGKLLLATEQINRTDNAPLRDVDFGLLAEHDGETATDTLDGGQRDPHLAAAINVGVEDTENVLEVWSDDKRLSSKHRHAIQLVLDSSVFAQMCRLILTVATIAMMVVMVVRVLLRWYDAAARDRAHGLLAVWMLSRAVVSSHAVAVAVRDYFPS